MDPMQILRFAATYLRWCARSRRARRDASSGALHNLDRHLEIDQPCLQKRQRQLVLRVDIMGAVAGMAPLAHACRLRHEGIVAKRVDLPYESGRTKRWLKIKNPSHEGTCTLRRRRTCAAALCPAAQPFHELDQLFIQDAVRCNEPV